ncbi:hypothetical protein KC992_04955, partial [Candidatus Saccharibacteria bacterium]|nr:hypothetical protein [Candidatus Saccharibacteria bacterium]
MPNKKKTEENLFQNVLRDALKHYNDPAWLGEHSPLASPYVLGQAVLARSDPQMFTSIERGKALRRILTELIGEPSAETDNEEEYQRLLLKSRYFLSGLSGQQVATKYHISRVTLERKLTLGIKQLETLLLERLNPSLRLEALDPPDSLLGREDKKREFLNAIHHQQRVAIYGPSGIGKTAFASYIVNQTVQQPVFWYTFHEELNDHLEMLLFALAFFLHCQNAHNLWAQLVADQGHINFDIALKLLRYDLEMLQSNLPILCFDDIDLLRYTEVEEHKRIVSFIDQLPQAIQLVLIGQSVPILVGAHIHLEELSLPAIAQLATAAKISLSDEHLRRLQTYTSGNPRLLNLFIALHNETVDLNDILSQM